MKRAPAFSKVLQQKASNKPLHYTPYLEGLLQQVQTEGNGKITWAGDKDVFGKSELWDFPCEAVPGKAYGDCDDFVVWKLRRLIELGLPSTPLLFTLGYTETNEYHAVLVVATDAGDFVLDNRYPRVMRADELIKLGYNFEQRVANGSRLDGLWVQYKLIYPVGPAPPPPPPKNIYPSDAIATARNFPLCPR